MLTNAETRVKYLMDSFKKGAEIDKEDLVLLPREVLPFILATMMNEINAIRRSTRRTTP